MATIRAVSIHACGGPEVLRYEDAPKPEPAESEVLVKVHGAGVNPMDDGLEGASRLPESIHSLLVASHSRDGTYRAWSKR